MTGTTLRQFVAPAYLLLCLILGGSAQGIVGNLIIELLGLAIIAWSLIERPSAPLGGRARQLLWLVAATIVVILLQLIPLPAALWTGLHSRQAVVEGLSILSIKVPAMPISLAPYHTIDSALLLIPPVAMIAAIVRLKAYRGAFLVAALVIATLASVMLAALQVSTSRADLAVTAWYLYSDTNYGVGVGFFANANHLATLFLITIPFVAAVTAAVRRQRTQRYWGMVAVASAVGLVVCVGLGLNGSLAGLGLAAPVLIGSVLLFLPPTSRFRPLIAIGAGLLMAVAIAGLWTTSIGMNKIGQDSSTSVTSRTDMLATTATAARDFFPLGSGLGSFQQVYHLYEPVETVTMTYVIHAHNDIAEVILELGLAGLLLMLALAGWWVAATAHAWRTATAGPLVRAASIASAAVMAHSLVDFPLRTAAISACFGMCLALLADRREVQQSDKADLRPTRHVVFR